MHLMQLKARILDYLHHLTKYDYIAYGWLLGILIGFLLLAVVLSGRKPKTSLFFILIVLILMLIGPFGMKYALDQTVRKVVLIEQNVTELPFARNLIVLGKIKNLGRVDMAGCRIFVDVVKKDENRYKQLLYRLKPLRKEVLAINQKVPKGKEMPYKIVFDHFKLKYPYSVTQSLECF